MNILKPKQFFTLNGVTIISRLTQTSGFLNFSRKKETISNQKGIAYVWEHTSRRSSLSWHTGVEWEEKDTAASVACVTPALARKPLQFSLGFRARSESHPGTDSQLRCSQRYSGGKEHCCRSTELLENNLIAFGTNYVYTGNLFSQVFCLNKNGKLL